MSFILFVVEPISYVLSVSGSKSEPNAPNEPASPLIPAGILNVS